MALDYDIIKELVQQRKEQLGCNVTVYTEVKQLVVYPGETQTIIANGDTYYINEIDPYLTVESDNGFYDNNSPILNQLENKHTGTIQLSNNINSEQRIKFIIISYIK